MNINNIELGDHVIVTYEHGVYKGEYTGYVWEKRKNGCVIMWDNEEDKGTTTFIAYRFIKKGRSRKK